MSHITGTVQTVAPVVKLGPDFGPATNPPNTWTLNFAHTPAPTGTKFVMLHFAGASFPASNRLEVDLGYDTDVFTSADGSDFWTRPINLAALAGGLVPVRYITNGASTGGVQLDQYGRGERHTKDPTNASSLFDSLSNSDPFLLDPTYVEPDYAKFWLCNMPPNWENVACIAPTGDIRNAVLPAVGMIVHVDANADLGPILSTCTVTLVSPDTVITAGHCMADPIEDAKSASIIFNYQTNCDGTRPAGYVGRFFKVKDVLNQRFADGSSNDYCLLRLKVPPGGLGITPRAMRTDIPSAGEQVFGIHHPNGAVKKLSIPHPSFATVSSSGATFISVNLDVAGGSSGSALFDAAGRVTGVLSVGGACGLSYFPTGAILQDIASPPPITRDVMIVFDRSGSMSLPGTSGLTKIEEARAAASLFVQLVRANTGNRVGLVSFSTTASSPVDFALSPVTAPNKTALIGGPPFNGGIVAGLAPGGSTTIGGGLNAAFSQLNSGTNLRNVLLLTDGMQNTPPMVNPTDPNPTNIFIDVIGYGTPASLDGNMLTQLAASHRGQYVLADTNLKLQKFFALAFGNIFETGTLLDPEFDLPAGQSAAAPLPFDVCEEETLHVVVGWDNRAAQLAIEVVSPLGVSITAATSGVDSSTSSTWTFLRIPLPHGGERDGKWQVVVFRPASRGEFSAASPETRYFVNVIASGGALLRPQPRKARYYTGDTINPLVGLQYRQGGLPPNAKLQVTVSSPDAGVGNLLSAEKLGAATVIDADTIPPRQSTLMAIEARTGKPVVAYKQQTFDLGDDVLSTNSPEPAGIFGKPLKEFLTLEGNYTFHFRATYGEGCTATRELLWSVHVDTAVDPSKTIVTSTLDGSNKGTLTFVPKDKYGNNLGPGRGGDLTVTPPPGTTFTGPVKDNGDGSYTVPVSWDPGSGNPPGVVVGQPGRPPVVVTDPSRKHKGRCRKWKFLFWLALLAALLFLILWLVK